MRLEEEGIRKKEASVMYRGCRWLRRDEGKGM